MIYCLSLVAVPASTILALYQSGLNPYITITAGLSAGFIICACLQTGFAASVVGASLRSVLIQVYVQPLAAALLAAVPVLVATAWMGADGFGVRLGICGVLLTAFGAVLYVAVATPSERRQAKELIGRAVSRIVSKTKLHGTSGA